MKKDYSVYVILSATELKMGKIIRFFTRYKYNHVSITLDDELRYMYSFARYYKKPSLYAGFVKESMLRYKDSKIKIYKIPIDKYTYRKMKRYFKLLEQTKNKYLYNLFSALFFVIHKKVKIDKSFTCIEFTLYTLSRYVPKLNIKGYKFYSIKDLDNLLNKYLMYEGSFIMSDRLSWNNDSYLDNKHTLSGYVGVIRNIFILIYRFVRY